MTQEFRHILGMRVDATTYDHSAQHVADWAEAGESRYVCVANVHMTMESADDPSFQAVVNNADMVTSDGMPLVWALRLLGIPDAERVYGPTLVLHVCEEAERRGLPIALYGGTDERLATFQTFLATRFPALEVVCSIAPPFRPPTEAEDRADTDILNSSGARIVFVGIGCPKQERWMADHRGRVNAVMLGVGAAFDFHSGAVRQAPSILQAMGLEWAFRLVMEPRRLWKRYFKHNPRFVAGFLRQYLTFRFRPRNAL